MFTKAPRRLTADLDVIPIRFESPPGDLDWVCCAHCQERLTLHQPDDQSPTRLLGFCDNCRGWYLILTELDGNGAMMVLLPEDPVFKAAWLTHEGSG